jgi:spore photoproduct lyase
MAASLQTTLDLPAAPALSALAAPAAVPASPAARLWMPDRVLFTPEALALPWGEQIHARVTALGLPVERLASNRLVGLRGRDERETYRLAKRTLSVVTAPPGQLKLQPIPPSADWQFHLAQGCPAHCQYCYLAGSLQGPPTVRAYANLPEILANLARYEQDDRVTSFEASCYTDPLSLEHLTGSLAETIRYFGTRERAHLRWVTKFAAVEPLLDLPHEGRTRARFSVNADPIARRWEGGVAPVAARLAAAGRLARPRHEGGGGYPVGLVVAPIMPIEGWAEHYARLLDDAGAALPAGADLTFELITHRFTPGSREVLQGWYPNSTLEMDESVRSAKRNKFGGVKHVYPRETMRELRDWFAGEIAARFPEARVLYWT